MIVHVTLHSAIGATHVLKIMRVVDSGLDSTCLPAESGVALSAPHLITAIDLVNASSALRTRLGVSVEEFGGFQVILVTFVIRFGVENHMAVFARCFFTGTTLPFGVEETSAMFVGASADESMLFRLIGERDILSGAVLGVPQALFESSLVSCELLDELGEFADLFLDAIDLLSLSGDFLSSG
jgi:hypothetical protein